VLVNLPRLPRQTRSTILPVSGPDGNRIVLNPVRASLLNARAAIVERLSRITASPPLAIADTPNGRCLYLQDEKPFPAVLTGTASPYAFAEVYATPSGEWELLPGGRTGQAIEVNGVSGLGA
jgi:hypothetical protein